MLKSREDLKAFVEEVQPNNCKPAANTSTLTGTGVDCQNYEGQMLCHQQVGTVSGTSPTLDGKIQESSDNSTFTDISGATFTQVTASNSLQTISFTRTKRYVRYVGTIGGTTPSFTLAALFQGMLKVQN